MKSALRVKVSVGRMDLDLVDLRSGRGGLPRERDWRVRSISASSMEVVRTEDRNERGRGEKRGIRMGTEISCFFDE